MGKPGGPAETPTMQRLNDTIGHFFGWLGGAIHDRPWRTNLLSLLVVVVCMCECGCWEGTEPMSDAYAAVTWTPHAPPPAPLDQGRKWGGVLVRTRIRGCRVHNPSRHARPACCPRYRHTAGFADFKVEDDSNKLYAPQDSVSWDAKHFADSTFGYGDR